MLPNETILAIFPPRAADKIGRALGFQSVTLAHIAAMEAMGIDLDKEIDDNHIIFAAWILTQKADALAGMIEGEDDNLGDFATWAKGCGCSLAELRRAVEATLTLALSTIVEPERTDGTTRETIATTGLGWVLELAEWFASEYKITPSEAIVEPLVRIFACVACARQRNGGKHGSPDYYEKHRVKAMMEKLQELQKAKGDTSDGKNG